MPCLNVQNLDSEVSTQLALSLSRMPLRDSLGVSWNVLNRPTLVQTRVGRRNYAKDHGSYLISALC